MGVHSTLTTSLASALLAGVLAAACGGDDAAPEATPTPAVLFGTPVPRTPTLAPAETPDQPEPTGGAIVPADREGQLVSLAWIDGGAEVPALPSSFAAPAPDSALRNVITTAVPDFDGEYSVVVHNLADGRYAAYNETKVYYAASLFKASLLYEAYRQRELGELDFSMEVGLTEEYAEYDLATLEYLEVRAGDRLTIEDAVRAMAIASDTSTAVLIQDLIGGQADQSLLALGLRETEFLNRELPTSARDMARLIEAIAAGEGVTTESRLAMLSLMRQEWFTDGVIAAAPPGTPVAHKTGSFADATHDAALVWGPAGPYVIVVMTDASYDFTYVREVAQAVYDYFAANP
jgi:beta-lactamase class A